MRKATSGALKKLSAKTHDIATHAKRIFGLDLLRSIAIILVLLTHTVSFIDPQNHYYQVPVYTGYFGVEFFFVLSGFLIGTILLKIQHQEAQIDFKSIKIFWIRRWFRTLPNYYLGERILINKTL
jgi:peptidoglycan/LPS O-acetylase OafA/YrhL